jgi:hypothetical protein
MPLVHQVTKLARRSATCSLRAFLVSPRSFTPAYSSAHTPRFLVQPPLRVPQRVARPCSVLCARSRAPNHGSPSLRTGRSDAQWTVSRLRLRKTCPGARKQSAICLKRCLVKRPPLMMEARQRVGVRGLQRRSPLRCVRRGCGLGASTSGAGCGRRLSSMGMYCI